MSTANATITAHKATPKATRAGSECCADHDCGSGLRNRYFVGKQLSPHSFQVEQRHLLERRRLLNRALHGWGVVYGFAVSMTSSGSLLIKPGLALDANGRELLQVEELTRAAAELIVLDENGQRSDWPEFRPEQCWLLSAHYAEQDASAVKVSDPCQCEHKEWDYTCETVRFSLRQSKDCDECCQSPGCTWDSGCASTGWCKPTEDSRPRGGRLLCDHAAQQTPGSEGDRLWEIDEACASVRVDLYNGVPLACVKQVADESGGWRLEVDTCAPRRSVKSNDSLFDLIQGCDLTTIKEIGWGKWHRKVMTFDEFSKAFGSLSHVEPGDDPPPQVAMDFWVEFSRPVHQDTFLPDCFAMTIMASEREGDWWQTLRVPIVEVDKSNVQNGDPGKHFRRATIVVDGRWLRDAVTGFSTIFQAGETRVEIEVRGDFIIDCNGQAVDANAVGTSPGPTGNGTPGGTFLSTFRVEQAPAASRTRPVRLTGR